MSNESQTATGDPALVDSLRRERDRFVALAFCAADILIEVDTEASITYAAGASKAFIGAQPEALVGTSFFDLIVDRDRAVASEIIRSMTIGQRLKPVPINLAGNGSRPVTMLLNGYILPQIEGSIFFALRRTEASGSAGAAPDMADLTAADPEGFAKRAARQLREAQAKGEDANLTMVRIDALNALRARIDENPDERISTAITACLRASGGQRQVIGRIDSNSFGMVHSDQIDIDGVRAEIQSQLVEIDPEGRGAEISIGSAAPDIAGISNDDLAKALHFTIRSFCEESDPGTAIAKLAETLHAGLATSSKRVNRSRQMVSGANFDVALQPIIRIATGNVVHFEALARFGGGSDRSPYELITFAENAGLICDFDYAMASKLLEFLSNQHRVGLRTKVAVNLSGNSVTNPAFAESFFALLERHATVRTRLMVEITETVRIKDLSVANRFIQSLRQAGHIVCLDDFGAGAAALQYLHDIEVDIVKIDGQYIQSARQRHKSRALLRAIAGLCKELGIVTVGEMIEDQETLQIVKDCGIDLGQGYLFGRPTTDIEGLLTKVDGSFSPNASAVLSAGSDRRR